jgi:hypothetical protein
MNVDFSHVYPTLLNWGVVGLMAVTFIAFFKWMTQKYNIPGLSDLFAMV